MRNDMQLRRRLLWCVGPLFVLLVIDEMLLTGAYMNGVRLKEIPFSVSPIEGGQQSRQRQTNDPAAAIHAVHRMEEQRSFFHIFKVPYIVCFFAAKGKWPFIPPFMEARVEAEARTLFSHNDSYIKRFCHKWIQVKECFRPIFGTAATPGNPDAEAISSKRCECASSVASPEPMVYFDRDHIGNVSSETIRNTIEFLEDFLPPPPKKTKRKNRVRSRLDEIDID